MHSPALLCLFGHTVRPTGPLRPPGAARACGAARCATRCTAAARRALRLHTAGCGAERNQEVFLFCSRFMCFFCVVSWTIDVFRGYSRKSHQNVVQYLLGSIILDRYRCEVFDGQQIRMRALLQWPNKLALLELKSCKQICNSFRACC